MTAGVSSRPPETRLHPGISDGDDRRNAADAFVGAVKAVKPGI